MEQLFKTECRKCAGHLEFGIDVAGKTVNCPHCGAPVTLLATLSDEEALAKLGIKSAPVEDEPDPWRKIVFKVIWFTLAMALVVGLLLLATQWLAGKKRQPSPVLNHPAEIR